MEIPDWFIDEGEGVLLNLDDPRVPVAVQEHGHRFKNPARYAHDFGEGAYLLYAEDGELLDVLTCREP